MKKILIFLILLCIEKSLHAQQPYVYTIKADSVKITNTCDTAELIIENHTQNVPGFLFNKGRGRTEFRRVLQSDDTTVVIGGDTIHLGRGNRNFANADLTFTGDRNHNGAFHYLNLNDFGGFDFKASNYNNYYVSEFKMDTNYATVFSTVSNEPGFPFNNSLALDWGGLTFQMTDGTNYNSVLKMEKKGFEVSNVENSWAYTSISTSNNHESGSNDLIITDKSADLKLINIDSDGEKYAAINLCQGDSIVIERGGYGSSQINTRFVQYIDRFIFRDGYAGTLNFRLLGLPASSSTTDSMLVVDNNGQVKKRSQSPTRKSATVTGSSYTVPSDIDVVFVNYTAGQATITLPTGTLDREITIKNLHTTNTVILSGLDSSESNSIATRGAITVKYTGSSWVGIGKY